MRYPALIVAALLAPTVGFAQPKAKEPPKPLPEGVTAHRDLAYGDKGERNTLDLFIPKSDKPLPLIIWVHGGGWSAGSKANPPALFMLEKGYAVASINYRLSQTAKFPAQIEDSKAAVRYLRANAKKFKIDPDRFGAWGGSAGGHLVAMLGTTGDVKDLEGDGANKDVSSRVQAVCDFYGPTDMTRFKTTPYGESARNGLLGGNPTDKSDLAAKASPVKFATKDDAPSLLVHGDKDDLVPLEQSEFLEQALKSAQVPCEVLVIKGAGHGGPAFASQDLRKKIVDFFDKHLKQ